MCSAAALLALGAVTAAFAQGPSLQTVRLICLPGTPLPVVVGQMHGTFAKYGLEVQTEKAKDANQVRADLASGKADIAESAVQNAVATVDAGADVIIVMGGEGATSELIAQPDIKSVKDLRGKTIATDGSDTEYTMLIKKILLMNGLKADDYTLKVAGLAPQRLQAMTESKQYGATIEKPPTSILARRAGLVSLGTTQQLMGTTESQGIGAFVQRQWAQDHAELLERYMAAFIESERWLMAPENKQQAIDLVAKAGKLPEDIAAETYQIDVTDPGGWAKDARFNVEGFEDGLKLEAEVGGEWGGKVPTAKKYYDLSYYDKALAIVK